MTGDRGVRNGFDNLTHEVSVTTYLWNMSSCVYTLYRGRVTASGDCETVVSNNWEMK